MNQQRTTHRFDAQKADLGTIRAKLNRAARGQRLMRVELRVSSQASVPIHLGHARTALMDLLRERGLTQVAVSVRSFELPLDDAMGEHQLVLLEAPKPPSPWMRLRTWLACAWSRKAPNSPENRRLEPRSEGAAPLDANLAQRQPPPPAISQRQVAHLLQHAAVLALRSLPELKASQWEIRSVQVRIRSDELYGVAKLLIPTVAGALVQWLGAQANRADLQAARHCSIGVEQLPDPGIDTGHTYMVGEGDVSIELDAHPSGVISDATATEAPTFA